MNKEYTLGVCLFCGGETGKTIPLGRIPNKEEIPHKSILSYEPCDKCKKGMALGVTLIAITKKPKIKNQPPIKKDKNLYPTGQFIVLTPESQTCIDNNLKTGDIALCEIEIFSKIKEQGEKLCQTKDND